MLRSLAVRLAFKAISHGFRLPRMNRLRDFEQQSRTMDEITGRRINVVLDVGANCGYYAKHLRMLGYSGRILSFEPDPETFVFLSNMSRGDSDWQIFNCALGNAPGQIDFNVIKSGNETVMSSILVPVSDVITKTVRVPVETVADVLDRQGIPEHGRAPSVRGLGPPALRGHAPLHGIVVRV